MDSKIKASEKIKGNTSEDVQAKRATFNYSNSSNTSSYMGDKELISDLQSGKVKLEDIKTEELPDNMKKMSLEERKKYVETMMEKRKNAEASLAIQIKEREAYVEKETAKLGEEAVNQSFSGQVHHVVVKQAQTKNIVIDKRVKN